MNKTIFSSAIILAITASFSVHAADKGLEKCIAAIQKQKTGELVKLEKTQR